MLRFLAVCLWLAYMVSAAWAGAKEDCASKSGDVAIAACAEAIRSNAGDAASYANRAIEYYKKGDYAQAIADYSKAIEINPKEVEYYNARAWTYVKASTPAQALADAEKSLELRPNHP